MPGDKIGDTILDIAIHHIGLDTKASRSPQSINMGMHPGRDLIGVLSTPFPHMDQPHCQTANAAKSNEMAQSILNAFAAIVCDQYRAQRTELARAYKARKLT